MVHGKVEKKEKKGGQGMVTEPHKENRNPGGFVKVKKGRTFTAIKSKGGKGRTGENL